MSSSSWQFSYNIKLSYYCLADSKYSRSISENQICCTYVSISDEREVSCRYFAHLNACLFLPMLFQLLHHAEIQVTSNLLQGTHSLEPGLVDRQSPMSVNQDTPCLDQALQPVKQMDNGIHPLVSGGVLLLVTLLSSVKKWFYPFTKQWNAKYTCI